MKQVKQSITKAKRHEKTNCFLVVLVCHGMEQGWLLDTNKNKAFTLEQFTADLSGVQTLVGKPKVLLIEAYGGSTY